MWLWLVWNLSVNILATLLEARADRHRHKGIALPLLCMCAHLPFTDTMISLHLTTPVFFPLNPLKYDWHIQTSFWPAVYWEGLSWKQKWSSTPQSQPLTPTLLLTGDYGKRDTPFVLGPPGLAIEKWYNQRGTPKKMAHLQFMEMCTIGKRV